MNAHIISIGNELLIGDTVNTNAAWLGRFLADHGIAVRKVHVIGDELEEVKKAFSESMGLADLVISTGGLGPTHDDVTNLALAELFDYHQAEVPENCEVMFNKQGTSPGLWFEEGGTCIAILPGVPFEMKHLAEELVWPRIQKHIKQSVHRVDRYIVTAGVGESTLSDELVGDLSPLLNDHLEVAYLPDPSGAKIRVTGTGGSRQEAEKSIKPVIDHIYGRAGNAIIGEGKDFTLAEALGSLLRERQLTIAVAESCTGGMIADRITDIPGSSDYFLGSVTAYANDVKVERLEVEAASIEQHGAVSRDVALQMARGVARLMHADIGLSTTGVAGPGGGSKEKPVGTTWIGYWSESRHFALHALFTNDRQVNKERGTAVALEAARRALKDIETMPYGLQPQFA